MTKKSKKILIRLCVSCKVISFFGLLGTAGALDYGSITIRQACLQIILFVALYVTGYFVRNMVSRYQLKLTNEELKHYIERMNLDEKAQ